MDYSFGGCPIQESLTTVCDQLCLGFNFLTSRHLQDYVGLVYLPRLLALELPQCSSFCLLNFTKSIETLPQSRPLSVINLSKAQRPRSLPSGESIKIRNTEAHMLLFLLIQNNWNFFQHFLTKLEKIFYWSQI